MLTPVDLAQAVNERAAIFELEAGLPRDLAADVAFLNVCSERGLGCTAGVAPFHRLLGQGEVAEAERINRFLRNDPSLGDDEFIKWLLVMPYVVPTAHEGARVDFSEGWQVDPEWWVRVVDWDVRSKKSRGS